MVAYEEAAQAAGVPLASAQSIVRRVEEDAGAELRASGVLHRYQVLRRPDRVDLADPPRHGPLVLLSRSHRPRR